MLDVQRHLGPLLIVALGAASARAEEVTERRLEQRIGAAVARPGGLTSEEVARRAVRTSADLSARRAEVDAASAAVAQSAVGFAPRLVLTLGYARLSAIDAPLLGYAVVAPDLPPGPVPSGSRLLSVPLTFPIRLNSTAAQAMLTLPLSDYLLRLSQSYTSARRSKRAADLQTQAQQLKVHAEARIAYYGWGRASLAVIVAEASLAQARGHLNDVRSSFGQGIASKADVLRVESQVASAEGLVERARNLRVVAEEQLRTLMHDDSGASYSIGEDLRAALPALAVGQLGALVAEAIGARPELRALEQSELSLAGQARAARAAMWPRLDGFGEVTAANPNQRYVPPPDQFNVTWSVGVRLSWSPNDLATAHAQGKGVDARARQVAAQRATLADGIRAELTQAVQAVRDADTAIVTSGRSLAAAEASYKVRRSLFQVGRATSVELTDAETDLLRARLESINARVDQRIARVRFEHATGRDATGSRRPGS
jgi:outer membrane protein